MAAEVIIYTTPFCPYCIYAKAHLRKKCVSFQEVSVAGDQAKRAWLREATGRTTVPQIFINGEPIGGCDDMLALDRQGRLDSLLAGLFEGGFAGDEGVVVLKKLTFCGVGGRWRWGEGVGGGDRGEVTRQGVFVGEAGGVLRRCRVF